MRRLALLALVALASWSCFEPPVAESLLVEFLPDGLVTVTVRLRIRDLEESNPALQRRIEQARREALEGNDAWSRRFEAFGPVIERGEWEKHEGRLVSFSRSATTDDPEALARFFADTGIAIEWRSVDGSDELSLYPPAAGSASRAERQRVSKALIDWSSAVAAYLARAGELWRHLEENPDRARSCLARVFTEYLPDETVRATGEISSEESRLLDALRDAMSEVTEVLEVPEGESHSLDELSRRVHDPFPAPLALRLPAPAMEVEGFAAPAGGSELRAGGASLWQALRGIDGRWLAPDPLSALVAHDLERIGDQPFPLEAFLARPRKAAAAPAAREVLEALRAQLEPAPNYRVVWSRPPGSEEAAPER